MCHLRQALADIVPKPCSTNPRASLEMAPSPLTSIMESISTCVPPTDLSSHNR